MENMENTDNNGFNILVFTTMCPLPCTILAEIQCNGIEIVTRKNGDLYEHYVDDKDDAAAFIKIMRGEDY